MNYEVPHDFYSVTLHFMVGPYRVMCAAHDMPQANSLSPLQPEEVPAYILTRFLYVNLSVRI